MALNTRAEILLKTLVERYIADGQPVGSRTLVRESGLDLSPATARNVLSYLEEMGFIRAPHTSAGRVPTERGYRMFVDSLIRVRPLNRTEVSQIQGELCASHDPQRLIECASSLLSEVSHLTGIVTAPRRDDYVAFRQIDFVGLSGRRLIVILVTEDGQVQNRIVNLDRDYAASELEQAANYFNDTFAGVSFGEVKRRLVADMERDSGDLARIMQLALGMARRALSDDEPEAGLVVTGESHLMDVPDLGDMRKLRRLFDAFNTKRDLLHLLDRSVAAGGVKVFIGSETGYEALSDCSVVSAPYDVDGHVVGTLAVIGPTRMRYERVIPMVDITARLLSSALTALERGGEHGGRLESQTP